VQLRPSRQLSRPANDGAGNGLFRLPGVGNRALHQRPLHAGRHSKCRRYDDAGSSNNNDSVVVVDCENDDSTHDTSNIRVVTEYNVDTINDGSDYADKNDPNNDDNNAR
jgi:hypothetical protein